MFEDFKKSLESQIESIFENPNVIEQRLDLIKVAQNLHRVERNISIESVRLVKLFLDMNASVNLNMTSQEFAWHIGLSPSAFWKRAQAARVMDRFPEVTSMLEKGATCISHIALAAPKITEANKDFILNAMEGSSTRELKGALASVQLDGSIVSDQEAKIVVTVTLSKEEFELLERAKDILSHSGHNFSTEEALVHSVKELLKRKDPLQKAQRHANRGASPTKEAPNEVDKSANVESPKKSSSTKAVSRYIPSDVKHGVWLRDKGLCTYPLGEGRICGETRMLEFDHLEAWSRNPVHSVSGITLRCRSHNQAAAEQCFGLNFMKEKRLNAPASSEGCLANAKG